MFTDMETQGNGKAFTEVVATRVEPTTKDGLKKLAKLKQTSESAEARNAIVRHIEREAA